MAKNERPALRVIPPYDPDNNIGAVDRIRFCIVNNRMDQLHQAEHDQLERWKQIDDWLREKRYMTIDAKGLPQYELITGQRKMRQLIMTVFSVSWSTAERDIANTKKFFREAYDDQEYYRSVYIEDFERLAAKAEATGEYDAAGRLLACAAKLRGHYEEVTQDIPDNKIEAFQLNIEYNPEAVGLRTVENKEELFERWKKKKPSISDSMNKEADDAAIE